MILEILHCGFLEHWNSQKSVCNIWQHFSCLLDEGIPKICKKLNFHDGFLSYLQNSTANSAHLAARTFLPCLGLPSKSHRENSISSICGIPSSSRHEKRCQMLQTLFWLFQCSKNPCTMVFGGSEFGKKNWKIFVQKPANL